MDIFRDNYDYNFGKANEILNNTFIFLNMPAIRFENEIFWNCDPYSYKLWTFNLNYFDLLLDLVKAYIKGKDEIYIQKGLELILSWIKHNAYFDSVTWDPYVTAKRIVNWICFIDFLVSVGYWDAHRDRKSVCSVICNSLKIQAQYLSRNIEYDLGANHVIMEGKGLIFAGLALGVKRYFLKGLKILQKEFSEQILSDGGHYERSISYHIEVLMHYLETAVILVKNGKDAIGRELIRRIEPMFDYLYGMMKPNGCIPLLNDSSEEYPVPASEILSCGVVLYNRAEFKRCCGDKISEYALFLLGSEAFRKYKIIDGSKTYILTDKVFKDTGYYLIKDTLDYGNELYILFDVGNNGPDYNLGHTHADNLNVLLSIGDNDIFTDPGAYTYKAGKERDYFRSTSSHNTITIDDISSSQIWGSFRVAKRAYSHVSKYSDGPVVKVISGYHDGYTKVLEKDRIFHGRTLIYYKRKWLLIIDSLYGKISNNHEATLNYMMGENIEIRPECRNELCCVLGDGSEITLWFNYEYVMESAYVSRFMGQKNSTSKITIKKDFDKNEIFLTLIAFDRSYKDINIDWEINDNEVFMKFNIGDRYESLRYKLPTYSGEIMTLTNDVLYF